MIEIVYKEEKKEAQGNEEFFQLPKNIRQIGESQGNIRIYVEDYVYTFLKRMPDTEEPERHAGILLGRYKWRENISYLFIESAMELQNLEVTKEHIPFNDQIWDEIHKTTEQYFENQEILGWYLRIPDTLAQINDVVLHTHLNHFAGNDKVLFLVNPRDREEAFFTYENGGLRKENGFYIYYEKNDPMQEYLIDFHHNQSIEAKGNVSDHAVVDFRKAIEEKQEEVIRHGASKGAVVACATCVAAALLGIGLGYMKHAGIWQEFRNRDQTTAVSEQTTSDGTSVTANTNPSDDLDGVSQTPSASAAADASDEASQPSSTGSVTDDSDRESQTQPTGISTEQPSGESSGNSTANLQSTAPDNTTIDSIVPDNMAVDSTATDNTAIGNTATESVTATDPSDPLEDKEDQSTDTKTGVGNNPSSHTVSSSKTIKSYLVQKGDTLSKISMENYGSLDKIAAICELNHLESAELIYIGQKILLP